MRWLIGTELTRLRRDAKLSVAKASALTGIGAPKIGHLENGRQQQTEQDIDTLLSAYGADAHSISRLVTLAARTDEANWWRPWSDVVDPWFSRYVGLERVADRKFRYEPSAVPGLLQTRDYALAMAGSSMMVRADHVQRVVDFRMARAARPTDPERPMWLHVVMTSWGLDLEIGNPEVRAAQLMHLMKMAELPTVTIQVLRPQDGPLSMQAGRFALLDFDAVTRIVYAEVLDGALYYHDKQRLQTYHVGAGDLQRIASTPERSLELIRAKLLA